MRRKEREIKGRARIEAVIKRAQVLHVGLAGKSGPYVVPVNFGYRNNTFYFHSAPEGRKIDMLRINPRVCFQLETDLKLLKRNVACAWGFKYRCVMGTGRARILTAPREKKVAVAVIMRQYSRGKFTFNAKSLSRMVAVRIDVAEMTGKQSGYA